MTKSDELLWEVYKMLMTRDRTEEEQLMLVRIREHLGIKK